MLKLEKQKITSLSASEMEAVHGGAGPKKSNKNNGYCKYSYRRPNPTATSCKPRKKLFG
ncbi:MAG: hypothetical protein ACFB10_20715 [Salibacteraceae bacterium]